MDGSSDKKIGSDTKACMACHKSVCPEDWKTCGFNEEACSERVHLDCKVIPQHETCDLCGESSPDPLCYRHSAKKNPCCVKVNCWECTKEHKTCPSCHQPTCFDCMGNCSRRGKLCFRCHGGECSACFQGTCANCGEIRCSKCSERFCGTCLETCIRECPHCLVKLCSSCECGCVTNSVSTR
jgi:hypothetical protein